MPYIGPWEEFQLMRVMDVQEESKNCGTMRAFEEGKGLRSSSYHFYLSPLCNGSSSSTLQQSSLIPPSYAVAPMPGIGDVFLYPFHLPFDRNSTGGLSSLPNVKDTQVSFSLMNKPSSTTSRDLTLQCSEQLSSAEVPHLRPFVKRRSHPPFSSFSCILPELHQNAASVEEWRKAVNHDSNDLLEYLRGRRQERLPPSAAPQHSAVVHPTEVRAPHLNPSSEKFRARDLKKGRDTFPVTALDFQRLGHLASMRAARRCGFPYVSSIKPPRSSFDLSLDSFSGNVPSEIEIANRIQYRLMVQQLEQQQLCRTRMRSEEKEMTQSGKEMENTCDSSQSDERNDEAEWLSNDLLDNSGVFTTAPHCLSSSLSASMPRLSNPLPESTSSTKEQKSSPTSGASFMRNGEENVYKMSSDVALIMEDDEESVAEDNDFNALLDWAQKLDPSSI